MSSETKQHILLLPFMAQGHIRPFVQLAHRIKSQHPNITVTLLTTPLNAQSLRASTTTTTTTTTTQCNPEFEISELPFSSSDFNLPPNFENTDKLPLPHVITLFHASASLKPHLQNYLSRHFPNQPPLCIIFDVFLGWANSVAIDFNTPGIAFSTGGAYGTAAYCSIWAHLPHRNLPEGEDTFTTPGFPDHCRFHLTQLHRFLRAADGTDQWSTFFQPNINSSLQSSGWLCNSVDDIEPTGFQILRNYTKLPIWGVGPLISSERALLSLSSDHEIIKWLDDHAKDSVLYISFGSQNTISPTQMMELAYGLELSGKSFIWVIRPPFGYDINGEFKPEWLPDGFEGRMRERKQGMLVQKWGPQVEILGHEATGAFLSHCGWNSVLEGLREGKPIIGWPLAAEQAYNSKMMVEETGVAVEVARGLEGGVGRGMVKEVVEMVLDRREGSVGWEMKRKAGDVGRMLKDAVKVEGGFKGSAVKALDDFVDVVVKGRRCGG